MFTDSDISMLDGFAAKSDTGMDLTNAITIILANGILTNDTSSAQCIGDNIGVIAGTDGNLIIDNIINPQTVAINGPDTYIETIRVPQRIPATNIRFNACASLADGLLEPRAKCPRRD